VSLQPVKLTRMSLEGFLMNGMKIRTVEGPPMFIITTAGSRTVGSVIRSRKDAAYLLDFAVSKEFQNDKKLSHLFPAVVVLRRLANERAIERDNAFV